MWQWLKKKAQEERVYLIGALVLAVMAVFIHQYEADIKEAKEAEVSTEIKIQREIKELYQEQIEETIEDIEEGKINPNQG